MPKSPFGQRVEAHDPAIAARLAAVTSHDDLPQDNRTSPRLPLLSTAPVTRSIFQTATLQRAGTVVATISCAAEIGSLTIGRGAEANIRVDDAAVSSIHARITWNAERGVHVISDAGSTNGTRVNGQRIRGDMIVEDGAVIRLGKTTLHYCYHPVARRVTIGDDPVSCT